MNKEQLFQELSTKLQAGEITRQELLNRLGIGSIMNAVTGSASVENKKTLSRFSVTKMLYVLGAAIVVIGILIFVGQIWPDIGSVGRILITLGLGILITAVGSGLLKSKPGQIIGSVFHAIGGLLIPGGAVVMLGEFSTGQNPVWPLAVTFGVILGFYVLLNAVHKTPVLAFFAIANGTAFIYLLMNALLENASYATGDVYAYVTMVVGASYLLFAQGFQEEPYKKLNPTLCFFGTAFFLSAAFSRVFDSVPWQIAFFFIVIGGLFLSAQMRSRGMLLVSTLFLIIHVSYITSEYFADSIGWPISLVILGFIFIGLAYMSININKKYITESV